MALVQSNACDPFDRLSQRELLARILSSAEPSEQDDQATDWSSDSEHEYEEQGKKKPLLDQGCHLLRIEWFMASYLLSFLVFRSQLLRSSCDCFARVRVNITLLSAYFLRKKGNYKLITYSHI
jgi:hypothetical protein